MILTPRDCSRCHAKEYAEFESSHHAKAGDILASLDNVLAERAAGMPGNIADAVSGRGLWPRYVFEPVVCYRYCGCAL